MESTVDFKVTNLLFADLWNLIQYCEISEIVL
jgi:hypothetical protein